MTGSSVLTLSDKVTWFGKSFDTSIAVCTNLHSHSMSLHSELTIWTLPHFCTGATDSSASQIELICEERRQYLSVIFKWRRILSHDAALSVPQWTQTCQKLYGFCTSSIILPMTRKKMTENYCFLFKSCIYLRNHVAVLKICNWFRTADLNLSS